MDDRVKNPATYSQSISVLACLSPVSLSLPVCLFVHLVCFRLSARTDTEKESAQKVDPGEENCPAAPAGTRTRNQLSTTSRAFCPRAIAALLVVLCCALSSEQSVSDQLVLTIVVVLKSYHSTGNFCSNRQLKSRISVISSCVSVFLLKKKNQFVA